MFVMSRSTKSIVIVLCVLAAALGISATLWLTLTHQDEFAGKSMTELREMHAVVQMQIRIAENTLEVTSRQGWPQFSERRRESQQADRSPKDQKRIAEFEAAIEKDWQLKRQWVEHLPELRKRLAEIESAIERCRER